MTAPKWYDMTISKKQWNDIESLKDCIRKIAERFVIGEEVGESGYEHYQIRMVLKEPTEQDHMIKMWGPFGHVSPTHVRDFKYCEKEGKFYRSWEEALNKFAFIELLPWQEQAVDVFKKQTDREIMVIVDEKGNHGKSWLAKHMHVTRMARYAPVMDNAQDIISYAMACPSAGYIFDVPKSDSVKINKGIWSAIETIKNGHLYDKRYHYQEMWIDPPKILIFTNEFPPIEKLSGDRWKIFTMENWGKLDHLVWWGGVE